jgi:hypothetical protein
MMDRRTGAVLRHLCQLAARPGVEEQSDRGLTDRFAAAGDQAAAAGQAVPTPKAQQTLADAGTVHPQQEIDRAETIAAAGLRGPLAADLADAM